MADLCETAYAAGLFDGEGCVQLYMRPSTYSGPKRVDNAFRANLSLSSVDPAPILWLRERWGGSLRVYDGPSRRAAGHRPLHALQLTGKVAERFGRDIYPFLITKREQMELWLEARGMTYERGHNPGISAEELEIRRDLVAQIAALKKKEYSHR